MENRQKNSLANKAAAALQLGLLLLIAYFGARALIAFITPQSLWTLPVQKPGETVYQNGSRTAQSYDFSFDPFRRAQAAAPVQAFEDTPETTLNLKLFGLRAGENGSAIIQTPDNIQSVYSPGDEIINGVSLKSISANFVVLSINGRLEKLTFVQVSESSLLAPPLGKTNISAEEFFRQVEIRPVTLEGGGRGFRISPRFGSVKLSKFGFQNGDILLSLGGTDFSQGQPDLPRLSQVISRSGEITAKINRGGKVMDVKVKL